MKLSAFFYSITEASVGRTAIAVVFGIACLDLIGWMLNIPVLKSLSPHLNSMKIPTAICLLLSAGALACLLFNRFARWRKKCVLLAGAVVTFVGMLVTAAYLFEFFTGRQWPWTNDYLFPAPFERMAVITAIMFSLYGCVLILLGTGGRRAAGAGHIVLIPVSVLAYLVIIGFLFHIPSLHTWLKVSIALNTSIAFCGLCAAAFCVRPDTWFMNVFTNEGAGATMARRLLPFLLLLPLLIGWLRIEGERSKFFESEVGVAIVAVTYTFSYLWLVWLNARSINRTDTLRRMAEDELKMEKNELEKRVKESTIDLKKTLEASHRLAAIVESSDDAIIGKTLEGIVTSWNHAAVRLYGYSADEAIGKSISFLVPPDRPSEVPEILEKIRQGKEVEHYETVRIRKDGRPITVSMTVSPIKDSMGIVGVSTIASDITQHKQMEDELRRASIYSRSLIEASIDPLVTISPEGRITDVNAATERVTGYSRQRLVGTDFSDYFTQPDRAREGYRQVLREGFVRDYPLTIRNISGNTFEVLYNATVFLDQAGEIQGVFAAARDVTELKRAEAALSEAKEMKLLGQLTSGVAHEVRNPLNGIMAIMGALSKDLLDNERFQPYMQHMRSQVSRLTTLMEDLLALGRPLRQENMHEVPMVTLVDNALFTWLQTLQTSKPSIRFIKPENPEQCLIWADATTMTQVIINLLENAYNHSPKGAEILGEVHGRAANTVVFYVKDAGTGIAEEIMPRIFDPFFTTRKGGTGLGLPIVRHIVEIHQGSVFAYNNTDGPGATFEVVLPLYMQK